MNEIVVGVDSSDTARRAAEQAAELAHALGTTLHIVMSVKPGQGVNIAVGSDEFRTDWVTESLQFLDDLKLKLPHDKITRSTLEGDPAKVLCDEARRLEARMIVVGNRRVQSAARVLGSIASDVARHAPCDVLIVNTTGADA
jgi:nucleotide-binding universal stress UspA family protein